MAKDIVECFDEVEGGLNGRLEVMAIEGEENDDGHSRACHSPKLGKSYVTAELAVPDSDRAWLFACSFLRTQISPQLHKVNMQNQRVERSSSLPPALKARRLPTSKPRALRSYLSSVSCLQQTNTKQINPKNKYNTVVWKLARTSSHTCRYSPRNNQAVTSPGICCSSACLLRAK